MPALANRLKVIQDPKSLLWKWERTETVGGRTVTRYGTAPSLESALGAPLVTLTPDDKLQHSEARKRLSVMFEEETGQWRWSVRRGHGPACSVQTGAEPTMLEALIAGEECFNPQLPGRQPARR